MIIYNQNIFKNELQARWAVFFDTMGFTYGYENRGYIFGEPGWCQPEFWLPRVNLLAKVSDHDLTEGEYAKIKNLVRGTKHDLAFLSGPPQRVGYTVYGHSEEYDVSGIEIILSNYHNYYQDERQFCVEPGDDDDFMFMSESMNEGIVAAHSAIFNFNGSISTK